MNEELDIDKLFSKKFEKFEVQSSDEEWLKLSSKLSRSNFMKFSFATFNVFYLIALVAFAGTVTVTSVSNIKLSQKVNQLEQIIDKYQNIDSVESSRVLPSDSMGMNMQKNEVNLSTEKPITVNKTNDPSIKEDTIVKPVEPSNTAPVIKDTVKQFSTIPIQTDTSRTPKVKKVKKTVTIKKDNVVVKDTVIISKQKK